MQKTGAPISRKERRKEARQAKNQQKHQAFLQRQKFKKLKKEQQANRIHADSMPKSSNFAQNLKESVADRNWNSKKVNVGMEPEVKSRSVGESGYSARKEMKRKCVKRNAKTKFEEFLELDMKKEDLSAQDDLEMERGLAKKLKVKDGKLRGVCDEINFLLDGIPSMHESFEGVLTAPTKSKKHKKRVLEEFSGDEMVSDFEDGRMSEESSGDEVFFDFEDGRTLEEFSGEEMVSDFEDDCSDLEEISVQEIDTKSLKERKKRKKSKRKKEEDAASNGENMDSGSDLEGKGDEQLGEEERNIETPSKKRRRRKKKSKKKQDDNIVADTMDGASKPEEALDAEVALRGTSAETPAVASNMKYVAPHLRFRAEKESEEHTQVRRRIRGLLNRISESNVESVTGEIASVFRSVSRSVSSQIISDEVLAACSGGPRGNEQYAAVFAAFVAGMACSVGMDFSAKLLASLAKCFEDEYHKEDNLSLRNLTLLISCLCTFGVCSSDLIYDFLIMLGKRLTEIDVSTILTVLKCCGVKIRGDDPTAMKNFVQSVQSRVNEFKASSGEDQAKLIGKRMEFMLETICDIKNNKKRSKEETPQHTRIKKWLQKLRVEEIVIRGLTWSKLLDNDKKGQWWLSGDKAATTDHAEEVANAIDKEVVEAQKVLQLAASQRMNTDARRAIFCIIMSSKDYIDAFEKLLQLDLPGKQDREIMRVLVECCLQEMVFNKYYTALASKLCEHDKNHKYTLQYCLWDHFKELETMPLLRSMHLAKFVVEMVASFTLSLSILKVVELGDVGRLTPKRIMHFRILFESLFEYPDKVVWNVFTRIAVNPGLETLRHGIKFFIVENIVKTNNAIATKFKVAKRALNNTQGVLM